jgi:purine-nucleoside phosphorylase
LSAFDDFRALAADFRPEVFLVLGSGLAVLLDRIEATASLPFAEVPGLASSTVAGHRGRFTLGRWAGRRLLVSEGRLHYYEGHSWETVVGPLRIAAELGARVALLTNAAGGIRADLGPGCLLPLGDQIEWNRPWPWRQPPSPSPYSPRLLRLLEEAPGASAPGIYAAVTGPSYETPAEVRALQAAGADAVGMSTSREALAAVALGMECAAVSLITNRAAALSATQLGHQEVLATARQAAGRLACLLEGVLAVLPCAEYPPSPAGAQPACRDYPPRRRGGSG